MAQASFETLDSPPPVSPFDLLARELGSFAGRIERELRQGFAEIKASSEARLANIELNALRAENERQKLFEARIAELKDGRDGKDGDPGKDADLAPLINRIEDEFKQAAYKLDERLTQIKDGRDGDPGKDGEPGKDADIEPLIERLDKREQELAASFSESQRKLNLVVDTSLQDFFEKAEDKLAEVKDGDPGPPGKDGKMPIIREWQARVHYEGDIVTHNGSTYQAKCDTGGEPPGGDWAALALRGADGLGFKVRGTYDQDSTYQPHDIVARLGSTFVATQENPGPCPGEGWQLFSSAGKRGDTGRPGESIRGEKGDPGEKGASIIEGQINPEVMALDLIDNEGNRISLDIEPLVRMMAR